MQQAAGLVRVGWVGRVPGSLEQGKDNQEEVHRTNGRQAHTHVVDLLSRSGLLHGL